MLNTRENILKLAQMIKTFFLDFMGFQIQFNIVDRQQLLDAQANPEEHRDLVVRVGGYSAYFVDLPLMLQEEIISRTEQQF
jgi:formate C-acetyltransferase